MSYIPAKAMHHAKPERTGGGELGGVPDEAVQLNTLGWVLGAAGAGVAVAVAAVSLLSLRSSTPKRPAKRGRKPAAKAKTKAG